MSIQSLQDRRALTARDVNLLEHECAMLYRQCVIDGHEELYEQYNLQTGKLARLTTDLHMIDRLIEEASGHKLVD